MSQIAEKKFPIAMLLGGLSVNLNHLKMVSQNLDVQINLRWAGIWATIFFRLFQFILTTYSMAHDNFSSAIWDTFEILLSNSNIRHLKAYPRMHFGHF